MPWRPRSPCAPAAPASPFGPWAPAAPVSPLGPCGPVALQNTFVAYSSALHVDVDVSCAPVLRSTIRGVPSSLLMQAYILPSAAADAGEGVAMPSSASAATAIADALDRLKETPVVEVVDAGAWAMRPASRHDDRSGS